MSGAIILTTDFAFVEVMDPIEKSFCVKSCITWFRTKSNFSKRQAKFFSPILVTTEVSNDFLYLRLKKKALLGLRFVPLRSEGL